MKTVGVLLAAGNSCRFGGHKLTYPMSNGSALGLHSATTLMTAIQDCVAVVRENDTQFIQQLLQLGYKTIIQPQPEAGMGSSLARAIAGTPDATGWVIALADMPRVKTSTIKSIVHRLEQNAAICAPEYNGRRGHPVAFNNQFRQQLMALEGDQGARSLLKKYAQQLELIEVNDAGILYDVDTPEDIDIKGIKT